MLYWTLGLHFSDKERGRPSHISNVNIRVEVYLFLFSEKKLITDTEAIRYAYSAINNIWNSLQLDIYLLE